jgi:hypothetical protein
VVRAPWVVHALPGVLLLTLPPSSENSLSCRGWLLLCSLYLFFLFSRSFSQSISLELSAFSFGQLVFAHQQLLPTSTRTRTRTAGTLRGSCLTSYLLSYFLFLQLLLLFSFYFP